MKDNSTVFPASAQLDRKHATIGQAPESSGTQYYNYEGIFSIVFPEVVDTDYTFQVGDIGAYGCISDVGTLANFAFGKTAKIAGEET